MSSDYVPSFRRAEQRKAAELGISEDELRIRMWERRRAADAYPRPECLEPDELELLALRSDRTLPEARLRHVESCATCAALVEASAPRPGGLEALLAEVRSVGVRIAAQPPQPAAEPARIREPLLVWARLAVASVALVPALWYLGGPRPTVHRLLPLDELTSDLGRHGIGTVEPILPHGETVVLASYETGSSPSPSLSSARYLVKAKCRPFGPAWLSFGRAKFQLLEKGRTYASSKAIYSGCGSLAALSLAFVAAASDPRIDVASRQITTADLVERDASEIRSAVLYLEGINALYRFEPSPALRFLSQAVEADPRNPFTHMALSEAWGALGYEDKAVTEAKLAAQLADGDPGLTQVQRELIAARFFIASANWDQAIDTYGALSTRFPHDETYALKLAEAQVGAGQARQALATLENLRTTRPETQHDPRVGLLEATAAGRLPDYALKRDAAMRAAEDAMAAGSLLLAGKAQLLEAQARYAIEDDKTRTLELYRHAEATFVEAGYSTGVADIRVEQARILGDRMGQTEQARELLLQARGTYQTLGNPHRAALTNLLLGHTEADAGRRLQARNYYKNALAGFDQLKDGPLRALALISVGTLDREEGRLDLALSNLTAGLQLCDRLQDVRCRAFALSNLASVHEARLELDLAFTALQETLTLRRKIEDRSGVAKVHRAMGEILLQKGQLADAQTQFREALEIQKQRGEPVEVAVTRLSMARLESARGGSARAIELAKQAEEQFRSADRKLELVQTQVVLADAYLNSGQDVLALASAERASDLLADIKVSDTSTLEVRDTHLSTLIAEARVEAATSAGSEARTMLANELAAWRGPSSATQLEARLQLGLLETRSGVPGGAERVASVRAEAERRHLGLLAKRAEVSPR